MFLFSKSLRMTSSKLAWGLPTRPFQSSVLITAKWKAREAGFVSGLRRRWPNSVHRDFSICFDIGFALHLRYRLSLLMQPWGHCIFKIYRRCFLWHASTLFSISWLRDQLLLLYKSTDRTCALYTKSFFFNGILEPFNHFYISERQSRKVSFCVWHQLYCITGSQGLWTFSMLHYLWLYFLPHPTHH